MNGTTIHTEISEIGEILSRGEEADWDVRNKAMVRLQELATSGVKFESFVVGLEKIKKHLAAQVLKRFLLEERSSSTSFLFVCLFFPSTCLFAFSIRRRSFLHSISSSPPPQVGRSAFASDQGSMRYHGRALAVPRSRL